MRSKKKKSIVINPKTKMIVISLFIGAFIIVSSAKILSLILSRNSSDKSLYFVQLINYSMPVIKISSFNSDDLAEKNKSDKEKFWSVLGVDINSPATFLGKEMALLKVEDSKASASLTPFVLKDTNILKQGADTSNKPSDNTNSSDSNLKKPLNVDKPEVLLYHSHTTESYVPHANNSSDENMNVCAVGDALEYELEKNYGVSVIHNKTIHDELGDIDAYGKSRETVEKYLKQYGSFKLIIDIHRDSSSNKKNDIVVVNGENVAKCMFVMCTGGPHTVNNMGIANKMTNIANGIIPNFFKNVDTEYHKGTLYFNQDLSSNSVLLEVGTNLNTVTEVKASGKYLARVIAQYLNGK